MMKTLVSCFSGLLLGFLIAILVIIYVPLFETNLHSPTFLNPLSWHKHQVIGFLPYWLLGNVKTDTDTYITNLTYFGLIINTDGSIQQQTQPGQDEPGWYDLTSGKLNTFFQHAKKDGVQLSLLLSSGDPDAINTMVLTPKASADTMVSQVSPLLKKYGFSDLNLDIEDVEDASQAARDNFTSFIKETKQDLEKLPEHPTLTIEVSPADLVHLRIIHLSQVAPFVDTVVLMAYDYHYSGSYVSGPVAPLFGGGVSLEYDTNQAVNLALNVIPSSKLILGIPLYGYEWDSLDPSPQSAVIPGSGVTASNNREETYVQTCTNCSTTFDQTTKEAYTSYDVGGYYDQTFYPTSDSTQAKIDFASSHSLQGLALWALGYDGKTILNPLVSYR